MSFPIHIGDWLVRHAILRWPCCSYELAGSTFAHRGVLCQQRWCMQRIKAFTSQY